MSPSLVVVGGPNGSGKTTFALRYQSEAGGEYLSADQLAATGLSEVAAGREFFARFASRIDEGQDLIVESTLSGRSISRYIDRARERGYFTTVMFVFLESADACVARVEERVRKGGHAVPEADVRRRFVRSIRNFWRSHRFSVQRWHLFYNAGSQFVWVATGAEAEVSVGDDPLYESFLSIAEGAVE